MLFELQTCMLNKLLTWDSRSLGATSEFSGTSVIYSCVEISADAEFKHMVSRKLF